MLAMNAKDAGQEGWLLNLESHYLCSLMKYAENRDLRHELYMAYSTVQ